MANGKSNGHTIDGWRHRLGYNRESIGNSSYGIRWARD